MNAAAAAHSGRSCSAASAASRAGVTPYSTARIIRSRSSVRNPRRPRTSASSGLGQAGPVPEAMSPARISAMIWSCSPPVSRVGLVWPTATSASRTIWKATEFIVRASGPLVGARRRRASLSRSAVAPVRVGTSTSTSLGEKPWARTRSATNSTRVCVLPEPGAPITAAERPTGRARTACWAASRPAERPGTASSAGEAEAAGAGGSSSSSDTGFITVQR
nr:hypothetical protein BJQ95_02503 [Cryobacterium sp. SO1]